MPEQNLPIKLFSKRTQDERRTPGMGDKTLPPWTLSPGELELKAAELISSLSDTSERIRNRPAERAFIPAVVQVSIRKEAVAKTHRGKIGAIFNRKNSEYNFIGLSDNLELLVKVESPAHFDFITQNLTRPSAFPVGVSAIDQIGTFHPEIDLPDSNEDVSLKIKLVNFQNRALNQSVEGAFEQTLSEKGINFVKTPYAQGLTVYKTRVLAPDSLAEIREFEGLFSITKMPKYTLDILEDGAGAEIPIKMPVAGEDYPTIGVLDSGIASIPHLAPWIVGRSTAYPDDDIDQAHGTFVAGIIEYGDELEQQSWVGKGAFKLFDATVYPRRGVAIDESDLISNIQQAVRRNQTIKIWNLSLGTRDECTLDAFSDFGQALDALQDQFDVLICKSAGNCDNYKHNIPKSRISTSADSIRSLVVGSMTHTQGQGDYVPEGYPSPFSRKGPAPNNLAKPDITHIGGNVGLLNGRDTMSGVNSFSVSGNVVQNVGTSFSTPRVSALIAGLNHRLTEKFDPLFLKALVIHSAKYPSHLTLSSSDRLEEMGYGKPGTLDEIIYNSPNEVTLILRDTVTKGGWTQILDFPFPQELVQDGLYYGEITVTLVAGTWLDGTQGPEYCQSNIEVQLGTYDSIKEHDISKRGVLNPVGTDKLNNILNPGFYSKRVQSKIDNPFMPERQLRNYNGKYHPVKKFAVNLQELTETRGNTMLQAPKKWCLQVRGLFLQAAEAGATASGEVLAQDFTLIITIRDPRKQHDVYSSVTRNLDANNFQHSNVRLRNEVQVNLRNSINGNEGTTTE